MSSAGSWVRSWRRTAIVVALALLPVVACSGNGGDGLADHPEIQRIVDAVDRSDAEALAARVHYTKIGCVTVQTGIGAPPLCEGDESHGDVVEALPMAGCEGFYRRPELVEDTFTGVFMGLARPTFYAAYKATKAGFPPGDTAVVFEVLLESQQVRAMAIYLTDGDVSGFHFGCSGDAQAFVDFSEFSDPIADPQ